MKGGIIYNMITRTGTNGSAANTCIPESLRNCSQTTLRLTFARISCPESLRRYWPPILIWSREPTSNSMFNTAFAFSGPIVRNQLWFAATGDYGLLDQFRVGNYNPDGSLFMDDNRRKTYSDQAVMANLAQSSASCVPSDAGQGSAPSHGGQSHRVLREPLDRASNAQRPLYGSAALDGSDVFPRSHRNWRKCLLGWAEHLPTAGSDGRRSLRIRQRDTDPHEFPAELRLDQPASRGACNRP